MNKLLKSLSTADYVPAKIGSSLILVATVIEQFAQLTDFTAKERLIMMLVATLLKVLVADFTTTKKQP